jgi:hypothetical protein
MSAPPPSPSASRLSLSSFDSVVRIPTHLNKWPKLLDSEPIAVLHHKFWGKPGAIGNGKQTTPEKDENEKEIGGRYYERVVEDEATSVDDNEDERIDDGDIIPGCHVLNLDLGLNEKTQFPEYKKIFVRADYVRIYDYLQNYFDRIMAHKRHRPPGAVVTGAVGIGEFSRCHIPVIFLSSFRRQERLELLRLMQMPRRRETSYLEV